MIEIRKLNPGIELYYKSIFLVPQEIKVKSIEQVKGRWVINLEDDCFIEESTFDNLFYTYKECEESCKKEHEEKLKKLRELLEKEK